MSATREADRERKLAELEQLLRERGQQRSAPAPVPVCRPAEQGRDDTTTRRTP